MRMLLEDEIEEGNERTVSSEDEEDGGDEDESDNGQDEDESDNGQDEDESDNGQDEDESDNGQDEDESDNGQDEDESDNGQDEDESDNGQDEDESDDTQGGGERDDDPWVDIDEIVLEAYTAGWEGVVPEMIEGETNPTLVLYEGEEYDIQWTNGDGAAHNIMIWDENEEVVADYATNIVTDDEQTLDGVVAFDEMAYYRCDPHVGMQGEIEVIERP